MNIDIEDMTGEQAKKLLRTITEALDALDALDCNDYFGTEGWKHFLGLED